MKSGINWSILLPADVPREVATARKQVTALRDRVEGQRRAVEERKAAIVTAVREDEQRMAHELIAGREAVSKPDKIEHAQAALEVEERRARALDAAISESESALGEAVEKARSAWLRAATKDAEAKRERALETLEQLRSEVTTMREGFSVAAWLAEDGGFDNAQAPRHIQLGWAVSSAR